MTTAAAELPHGCDLCGHTEATVLHRPERSGSVDRAFTPTSDDWGIFRPILRCRACGLWQSVPPPARELVATYNAASGGHDLYISEEAGRTKTADQILDFVAAHLGHRTEAVRLLDVGTWSGLLLSRAKKRGWKPVGLEPNAAAAAAGKAAYGVDILPAGLMEAALPTDAFDVVTLAESIEHFPSPRAALEKIRAPLRLGGLLYVSTPNAGGFISRVAGRRWPGFRQMHFYFFAPRTLGELLKKNGFRVRAQRPLRKNFSIGYILSTAMKRKISVPLISSLTVPIWAGDMELVAEKV